MAPPKTVVLSQQQQQQQGDQQVKHQQAAAKPRKRKAKQAQQSVQIQSSLVEQPNQLQQLTEQPKQQQKSQQVSKSAVIDVQESSSSAEVVRVVGNEQSASVVPSERTTLKKQQQLNQAPPPSVKEISVVSSKRVAAASEIAKTIAASAPPVCAVGKHQQISNEEADDVDAGIELDGSSNSGSSVKDMNEDQMKSASVSPVMAQSNVVNESAVADSINAKQMTTVAEVAPVEQLTKTICSDASPIKKTTKQQLAANQHVIDADEQQLQEKLQNKQRKLTSSQDGGSSNNKNTPLKENNSQTGDKKSSTGQRNSVDKSSSDGRMRRSFSSQSSQEEATLCKVCEQHVYQMERMLAEKSVYHKRCFRCHQCKIQLRVDNYSSHEGRVYCKAHHRQIFQPQVKLDKDDDVDIVAKSTPQTVDDYLLHRGRLSELSFSFLYPKPEGILKRQMIICENEPAELPKDVVRSDTKVDDGINQLNLNLNNILEKFERGTANINGEEDNQPSSSGVVIEKPSFNIKQTLMAFESKLVNSGSGSCESGSQGNPNKSDMVTERPIVKKLTNNNVFLNRQNSQDNEQSSAPVKPLVVRRSESLMMRLKKYESRIAGEHVDEDGSDGDEISGGNNKDNSISDSSHLGGDESADKKQSITGRRAQRPKKLTSIDLSSLKNQWENGDILKRRNEEGEEDEISRNSEAGDTNSPLSEKKEELSRIRQQLAQKKLGESGPIRNIYENAIKDAQLQQASRRDSSDLSALNGFSTNIIQQQLLQNSFNGNNNNSKEQDIKTPTTPNKDHFQLNLSKKANKLKEKFELGLITNSSHDDSDNSEGEEAPELTKLEQIRQEKLEDLSIFTDGQIKSREARNLFQQIDRRISAANGRGSSQSKVVNPNSLASTRTPMRTKLINQINASNGISSSTTSNHYPLHQEQELEKQQPIRLTNNTTFFQVAKNPATTTYGYNHFQLL